MDTIAVSGKAFVISGSTTRFVVRGIALSAKEAGVLSIADILSDQYADMMKNVIIPKLKDLNANAIRVYQVDPDNGHKTTMGNLAADGIYVMVGLANTEFSVKQDTGEYSSATFQRAARIVDEFRHYDNTLCFSVGNEVEFPGQQAAKLHAANPDKTDAEIVSMTVTLELKVAQAMKSFVRDIKAHISSNGYRSIPVGCAMQDGPQSDWGTNNPLPFQRNLIGTDIIAQYYAAGPEDERVDYIGINTYRYANNGLNAYDGLVAECQTLPVPVMLTETGAITNGPRNWEIVPQMYKAPLSDQLSGQIAFQMLEEGAGYGLYTTSGSVSSLTLTATTEGGAAALESEYGSASRLTAGPASSTPTPPTTAPSQAGDPPFSISWPTDLLPKKSVPIKNATITVENYADVPIQITQDGYVQGTVGAGSGTAPASAQLRVQAGLALSIQGDVSGQWYAVCGLPGSSVADGITVKNNVQWGPGVTCALG